jgi:hypothetical protein
MEDDEIIATLEEVLDDEPIESSVAEAAAAVELQQLSYRD